VPQALFGLNLLIREDSGSWQKEVEGLEELRMSELSKLADDYQIEI